MALWPFGKKNNKASGSHLTPKDGVQDEAKAPAAPGGGEAEPADSGAHSEDVAQRADADSTVNVEDALEASAAGTREVADGSAAASTPHNYSSAPETETSHTNQATIVAVDHDAVYGSTGPFDGDNVDIAEFDFSDFSTVALNLGSMQVPLPKESQVQVEMGENGPKMVHIVTRHGRATPVAFAAPRTGGTWEKSSDDIAQGMRSEGMPVVFENGPWGREIVGTGTNGIIRIIGVEGPRWLYRVTLASPAGKEDEMAALGRDIVARSFIYRGTEPILAGNSLPVVLPAQLAQQVQQAMQSRATQTQPAHPGQNDQENQAPVAATPSALSQAMSSILERNEDDRDNEGEQTTHLDRKK